MTATVCAYSLRPSNSIRDGQPDVIFTIPIDGMRGERNEIPGRACCNVPANAGHRPSLFCRPKTNKNYFRSVRITLFSGIRMAILRTSVRKFEENNVAFDQFLRHCSRASLTWLKLYFRSPSRAIDESHATDIFNRLVRRNGGTLRTLKLQYLKLKPASIICDATPLFASLTELSLVYVDVSELVMPFGVCQQLRTLELDFVDESTGLRDTFPRLRTFRFCDHGSGLLQDAFDDFIRRHRQLTRT